MTLALHRTALAVESGIPAPDLPGTAQPLPGMTLDLSRLLSRVLHPTPTGVDRVEMAYAQGLLRLAPDKLEFAAIHPSGLHGRLPRAAAIDFLHLTAERWEQEGQGESAARRWLRAAEACFALAPRPIGRAATGRPRAYLHLSPRGLERRALYEAVLRREGARFIPLVHDLIPLEHPEYARPSGPDRFSRRLQTIGALASGVLANSQATAEALANWMHAAGLYVPIRAAALGVPEWADEPGKPASGGRPYFVMLGTIEPRKNHLLLLHLWRRLVALMGAERVPQLVLVGRRGWENEMVLDMLDRTPSLRGVVREVSRVPDTALRSLIRGARAVLLPSFAEGFGLPVAEALALGAPVVASDLPALREAGGPAPDYLDPLDGQAWTKAILDYAAPDSAMRRAQLLRMALWRPPTWDDHLQVAVDFITEVCA